MKKLPVPIFLCFPLIVAPVANALDSVVAINELHYHPADGEGVEFVEIVNQTALPIDLSDWSLTAGVDFTFPKGTVLPSNEYAIVTSDPSAFPDTISVFGPYTGALSDGGETVRLRNNNGRVMDLVEYNDRAPWPLPPDGSGATLSKRNRLLSGNDPSSWTHSPTPDGTPGAENFPGNPIPPSPLVLNEMSAVGNMFWVEIFNTGETAAPLAGLAVEAPGLNTFTVPAAEPELAPGGFRVLGLGQADFAPPSGTPVTLVIPGDASNPRAILDTLRTRTFATGRVPDGNPGELAQLVQGPDITPGAPNRVTVENGIVINEIMYHHRPQFPDGQAIPFMDLEEEWVELFNRGSSTINLSGWSLDEAIRFTFPPGTMLAPGDYLVVSNDNPSFAAKFPGVPLAGGSFSGRLSNRGETLLLRDVSGNIADSVTYHDGFPWPDDADGGGSSLELIDPDSDQNNPAAWAASSNEAGSAWQNYSFRVTPANFRFPPDMRNFHELRIGLLEAGVLLLDDLEVIEDPDGTALPILQNGTFETDAAWRFRGVHRRTAIASDNGEPVLRIEATDNATYLNNILETTFKVGGTIHPVVNGTEYEIRFRAKWLSGSPQLRFEFYYNKAAKLVTLTQPATHGTPGAANSMAVPNAGPDLTGLKHDPIFPRANQPVTISVRASDPDGLGTLTLHYLEQGAAFQNLPMTDAGGGLFEATIPGFSSPSGTSGKAVQFYVEATDSAGVVSFAPAAGPGSRALYQVNNSVGRLNSRQGLSIVMLPSDIVELNARDDILSNDRFGCTVIHNYGDQIIYDCRMRLRGSMFSRRNGSNTGLNIRFPADQRFRGRLGTITVRIRGIKEAFIKHLINAAGGLHDNYNDVVRLYGNVQNGSVARVELARFSRNYVEGLPGGNGEDGTVFKMEGIREILNTTNGEPDGIKTPFNQAASSIQVGFVRNYDLADLGDDKELYRHALPINSNREKDDFDSMIAMCKAFDLSGTSLEEAAEATMNVDMWMRQAALTSLLVIGDTYTWGNPHNLNFYMRPSDGKIEPIPWDWDFPFNNGFVSGASSPLFGDPRDEVPERNLINLIERPRMTRLFYGHMLNHLDNVFSEAYFEEWYNGVARRVLRLPTSERTADFNFRNSRENFVRARIPAAIPFEITTPGPVNTPDTTVVLAGRGYFDVRTISLPGASSPLDVVWLDDTRFEVTLPVAPGTNNVTLVAHNFDGVQVGTDAVVVESLSTVIPASAETLVVSEIHYHPIDTHPRAEFLELMNASTTMAIDLSGVTIQDGVVVSFPDGTTLAPGERAVVVQDEARFRDAFGGAARVLDFFQGTNNLSNKSDNFRIELGGVVLFAFGYTDDPPWPKAPDGQGASLVLIAPETAPDPTVVANWRSSVAGPTPGAPDAVTVFSGDPDGDDNNDGLTNFINYALGGDGATALISTRITSAGRAVITFPQTLAADDALVVPEISSDLVTWESGPEALEISTQDSLSPGRALISYRTPSPVPADENRRFFRLRVSAR